MIKVLIADDQELIRESLKIVLGANEDMEVTGIGGKRRAGTFRNKKGKAECYIDGHSYARY